MQGNTINFLFKIIAIILTGASASKVLPNTTNTINIVGGTVVNPHELPYQIYLIGNKSVTCGGSILSPYFVLTAAHCVYQFPPSDYEVVAGEHDIEVDEGTEQKRTVSEVLIHPNFNKITLVNDIALLKMDESFDMNTVVQAIKLPPSNYNVTSEIGTVSGWGATVQGGYGTNLLRKTTIKIWTDEACSSVYDDFVSATSFCAGPEEGGKGICQGDSGGPFTIFQDDTRILVGIISGAYGCALPGFPGVFTEVAKYHDWMNYPAALNDFNGKN